MNARRRRALRLGFRRRIPILPPIIWLNLSKPEAMKARPHVGAGRWARFRSHLPGTSISIHLGFATWNTRTGWYLDGPAGLYWRQSGRR